MLPFSTLIKKIKENSFSPVYLFFGEERFLQEQLVSYLSAAFLGEDNFYGREKYDGSTLSLDQVMERLDENDLFSSKRVIIIDNPPYLAPPKKSEEKDETGRETSKDNNEKSQVEMLGEYLKHASVSDQHSILIFLTRGVDRRKKIYKMLDKYGTVSECNPLKGEVLASWIRNEVSKLGKKIDRQALEKILLAGNHDLYFLSNELNKYAVYLGPDQDIITTDLVDNLFSGDIQGDVFKLSDAMAEGDTISAYNILNLLFRRREKPLLIFFMLVRHYRLLLQTHSLMKNGLPKQEFASSLEVHPFVASKLREQAVLYNDHVLEEVLIALQDTDRKIKTGIIEPEKALELILARIEHIQGSSKSSV